MHALLHLLNSTATDVTPPKECVILDQSSGNGKAAQSAEAVKALLAQFRFTSATLFDGFAPNMHTLLPPMGGYMGVFQPGAKFVRAPLLNVNLFFGIGVFRVELATGGFSPFIDEERRRRFRHRLNALVPDFSPRPPKPTSQPNDGTWVESLGNGGSISLCFSQNPPSWFLVVRSGLDPCTLQAVYEELANLETAGATVFKACEFLFQVERLAGANRRRLASAVCQHLGLVPVVQKSDGTTQRAVETPCLPFEIQKEEEDDDDLPTGAADEGAAIRTCLQWLGADVAVPSWYVMPQRAPNGEPGFPAALAGFPLGARLAAVGETDVLAQARRAMLTCARTVEPQFQDTMRNVLRSDSSGIVRWFCDCTPASQTIALDGALDETMHVLTEVHTPLLAFPHRGVPQARKSAPPPSETHFAQDPEQACNPNLAHAFRAPVRSDTGSGTNPLYLTPMLVRVSVADDLGRTAPGDAKTTRSLWDCWTEEDDAYRDVFTRRGGVGSMYG